MFGPEFRAGGFGIGQIVNRFRRMRRRGVLPEEIRVSLETIPGWSWNPVYDGVMAKLVVVRDFVSRQGWTALDSKTIHQGVPIGNWVRVTRCRMKLGRLPTWFQRAAESVQGWTWDSPAAEKQREDRHRRLIADVDRLEAWWERARLRDHVLEATPEFEEGHRIFLDLRRSWTAGRCAQWVQERLLALPGWPEDPAPRKRGVRLRWQKSIEGLRSFLEHHDFTELFSACGLGSGSLYAFVKAMREMHRGDRLEPGIAAQLEALPGWTWHPGRHGAGRRRWRLRHGGKLEQLSRLLAAQETHGPGDADPGRKRLLAWANWLRRRQAKGILPPDAVACLESLPGWKWKIDRRRRTRRPPLRPRAVAAARARARGDLDPIGGEEFAAIRRAIRNGLGPLDEARIYDRILATGQRQRELAVQLGVSQTRISQRLALLGMPAEIVDLLEAPATRFTERHARAVRRLPDRSRQVQLALQVARDRLSVLETEDRVAELLGK